MFDAVRYVMVGFLGLIYFLSIGQINAEFSADTTSGCGSLGVQFTDQSTGNITSRSWSFGNGNNSILTNPFENFSIGTYTVSLTVSDGVNSDTETKTGLINVFSEPTADFTFNPITGCTPLPVTFNSTSTSSGSPIQTYIWDLDDGNQGPNQASFTHSYQGGGPYQPSLQIIDQNGCSDSKQTTNNVTPTPSPVAIFGSQASPIGCSTPFTVNFTNSSSGASLSYQWDFGDGNTSTQQSPSHTYTALGNYDVRLIVSDPNCSDTLIRNNFVRISITNADFTIPNDTVCFGQTVAFNNLSAGANNFSWDFDDGSPRNFSRDPLHVFQDSGWFDITLVASIGSNCIDQIIKQIYVQRIEADFDIQPQLSCELPDTIQFINQSYGAFSYEWRIPGSTDQLVDTIFKYDSISPTHIQKREATFLDTLIIMSEFGCADTMIKNIRVADSIDVLGLVNGPKGLSDSYGDCIPFTVTFQDSISGPGNTFTYFWDFKNGNTFNGKIPPPQLYDSAGIFEVELTVTNELGCSSTDKIKITGAAKQDPAFTVNPDTVCYGDTVSIKMTNSQGTTYLFSMFNNDYIIAYTEEVFDTGSFSIFQDTGYHSISVRVGEICDTIEIMDSAFYVLGPTTKPSVYGDCIDPNKIYFESGAKGYTRFYWDFGDGSPIDSVNLNPEHTYASDTVFFASLIIYNDSNRCGPRFDTTRIDLTPRLKPAGLPIKKNICRGEFIRLYYNNSLLHDTSNWYVNGNFVGNFESQIFPPDSFPNGINYVELIGINPLGCEDTIRDTFFISDPKASFASDVTGGCLPYDVQFFDSSSSIAPITSWEWTFSNNPSTPINLQNPSITVSTNNPVDVRLQVRDSIGCRADTLIENYLKGGNIVADFSTSQNLSICQGDSISFFNRTSGTNFISVWNFDDGVIDTINTNFVTHRFDSSGNFRIKLTAIDQNGCRDSLERYIVNVEANPIAQFTADTTQASCYPLQVNFIDQSQGNVNKWIWDLGGNDSISVQNPFRNFIQPGNFDIQLIVFTANGCTDTLLKQDFIQITGPTASFSMDKDTACLNEPISFQVTSQNGVGSYRWAFGDGNSATTNPASHTYTDTVGWIQPSLVIQDVLGNCEVFIRDSIYIEEVLSDFSLTDTSGCQPFQPQITNLMQGEDNFVWDLGDGRQSTEREPNFTYENPGTYQLSLTVNSTSGCTDVSTATILVNPKPTADISGDSSICFGDSSRLVASGSGNYSWYLGDSLLSMNNSITVSPDSSSTFSLVVTNSFNCSDTANFRVYVQQFPDYATLNDTTIIIGEQIFQNVTAGQGFIYSWSPPNGLSCTDCPNPIMQPLASTNYILRIRDSLGCFDITDTIFVEVIDEFTLDVPQAFSPNGDGINDVIYAKGWGLKELISFKIYNRFGELVFESNDFDEGWDGTYNGKDQVVETYVYTVEARTYADEILMKKGNITLLR